MLAEYKRVPEVTRSRLYLEALTKVLPKVGSVVVVQDGQVQPLPLLNLRDAQTIASENGGNPMKHLTYIALIAVSRCSC